MGTDFKLRNSLMLVVRSGDQAELLGHTYNSLTDLVVSVSKQSGIRVVDLKPVIVNINCEGLPELSAVHVQYPGYLGSGGPKTEYYAATVVNAAMVAVALYRRQRGEVEVAENR